MKRIPILSLFLLSFDLLGLFFSFFPKAIQFVSVGQFVLDYLKSDFENATFATFLSGNVD